MENPDHKTSTAHADSLQRPCSAFMAWFNNSPWAGAGKDAGELAQAAWLAGQTAEHKACWDAVNACIKKGDIGGNGCDKTAERNGLILATNIITARNTPNAKLTRGGANPE